MLFYLNDVDELDNIPSSSSVFVISRDIKIVNHDNAMFINELLPPLYHNSNKAKDYYKKFLKEHMVLLVPLLMAMKKSDIIIVSSEYDEDYTSINTAKMICKFFNKRYDIEPFEFTNDLTLKMRKASTVQNIDKYSKDLITLYEILGIGGTDV